MTKRGILRELGIRKRKPLALKKAEQNARRRGERAKRRAISADQSTFGQAGLKATQNLFHEAHLKEQVHYPACALCVRDLEAWKKERDHRVKLEEARTQRELLQAAKQVERAAKVRNLPALRKAAQTLDRRLDQELQSQKELLGGVGPMRVGKSLLEGASPKPGGLLGIGMGKEFSDVPIGKSFTTGIYMTPAELQREAEEANSAEEVRFSAGGCLQPGIAKRAVQDRVNQVAGYQLSNEPLKARSLDSPTLRTLLDEQEKGLQAVLGALNELETCLVPVSTALNPVLSGLMEKQDSDPEVSLLVNRVQSHLQETQRILDYIIRLRIALRL